MKQSTAQLIDKLSLHFEGLLTVHDLLPADRAAEFFAKATEDKEPAVMVGKFSHFSGNYGRCDEAHSCHTGWVARWVGDEVKTLSPGVHFPLWRPYTTKAGKVLFCASCRHDRTLGYCRQVEDVSLQYRHLSDLAYLEMSPEDYPKWCGKIRKQNQRERDKAKAAGRAAIEVSFTSFPTDTAVYVLHDSPTAEGGLTLPADRADLFSLMQVWSETPKGRRAGHGLDTWSGKKKPGKKSGGDKTDNDKDAGQKSGCFFGRNYNEVSRLTAEYLGIEQAVKGMKFDGFKTEEFKTLLDTAGVDYGEDVTLSIIKNKDSYTKRDKQQTVKAKTRQTGRKAPDEAADEELLAAWFR